MNVSLKKLTDILTRLQAQINAGGSAVWGAIGGTLADQTDLAAALNAKVSSVVAGSGISVDATDPKNPTVSATGSSGSAGTSIYWDRYNASTDVTFAILDKYVGTNGGTQGGQVAGTISKNAGKWYFEVNCKLQGGNGIALGCGVMTSAETVANYCGQTANSWGTWARPSSDRSTFHSAINANATTGAASATGQSARIAVDIDAGKLWLSYFGSTTWIGGGDPAAGTSPTFTFTAGTTMLPSASPRTNGNILKYVAEQEKANAVPTGFSYWPGRVEF